MTKLTITQTRSANGAKPNQRATLRALGLGRVGSAVEREDTPQLQGQLRVVGHLVEVGKRLMAASKSKGERESRPEQIGLHNLKPKPGSRRPRKRIGRGEGSGLGKTSGRGHKGYGSRSGAKSKAAYEGGQNPIHMRMRKLRGPHMKKSMPFENFRTRTQPVNLADLEQRFDAGAEVTPESAEGEGPREALRSGQDPRPRARSRRS